MRTTAKRVNPEDYILSVLTPEDRFDAAFKIAKEAFKKTKPTMKDIENAVKIVRRKAYGKKNKVVVDTGVLVSAFVFGGIPERAVKKAFKEADIFVSPALLEEYRNVPLELEAEGKIDHIQLKALISSIAAFVSKAKIVQPKKKMQICRDVEDNMLLECCHAAGADILITGDRDLLEIDNLLFNFKILTPREFIE